MKKEAFTLIEMMIAVLIGSMLLVMALPVYNNIILKARTQEAKSVIQSIVFAQERFKQENGNYYPNDNSEVKNERVIAKNLKINLSKSNNFNYSIKDLQNSDDGNFTIIATLRADSWNSCTTDTVSDRCKQEGSINKDSWVSQYNRDDNKHYIEFKYPVELTGDFVEGGISYEHLYDN